jgi:hypothetical protein
MQENKMNVTLTYPEIFHAANAGVMRRIQRLRSKIPPSYGLKTGTEWQLFIEGALAECALAKCLGKYWEGCGEINGIDVLDVEARSTKHENGRLIIYDADKDYLKYYLLTGAEGKYTVRGWMYGKDAKQEKYLDSPTGRKAAYFVPQSDLHMV